jgi:hypothetical protein
MPVPSGAPSLGDGSEGASCPSHYDVSEQRLCGPTVVAVPWMVGCTAVSEPIPVLWTISSTRGSSCVQRDRRSSVRAAAGVGLHCGQRPHNSSLSYPLDGCLASQEGRTWIRPSSGLLVGAQLVKCPPKMSELPKVAGQSMLGSVRLRGHADTTFPLTRLGSPAARHRLGSDRPSVGTAQPGRAAGCRGPCGQRACGDRAVASRSSRQGPGRPAVGPRRPHRPPAGLRPFS